VEQPALTVVRSWHLFSCLAPFPDLPICIFAGAVVTYYTAFIKRCLPGWDDVSVTQRAPVIWQLALQKASVGDRSRRSPDPLTKCC
jgi:hypothetical protein